MTREGGGAMLSREDREEILYYVSSAPCRATSNFHQNY